MADKTGIEWTDATWNPVVGCSVVSTGCANCYAMRMADRIVRMQDSAFDAIEARKCSPYAGTVKPSKAGPVWTGDVHLAADQTLTKPLRWRKPRKIFVNSMGDLFHESVPAAWIDRVFAVMALAPQHTFQVLTKRAKRMREYLTARNGMGNAALCRAINEIPAGIGNRRGALEMPLPNVWLGVSAERQQEADERIPDLLAAPAAVRFVSAEPLLGAIDFRAIYQAETLTDALEGMSETGVVDAGDRMISIDATYSSHAKLNWVIVGGESGPNARPMHPDWVRSIREMCFAADIPFFFKQWGEWGPSSPETSNPRSGWVALSGRRPAKREELYESNSAAFVERFGKSCAGRHLDGVAHAAFPVIASEARQSSRAAGDKSA